MDAAEYGEQRLLKAEARIERLAEDRRVLREHVQQAELRGDDATQARVAPALRSVEERLAKELPELDGLRARQQAHKASLNATTPTLSGTTRTIRTPIFLGF
jgi:chromosome segregation ATPase